MAFSDPFLKLARRFLSPRPRSIIQKHVDSHPTAVSQGYQVLSADGPNGPLDGWREDSVAQRQQEAFNPLLDEMRQGRPREDFAALAHAMRLINMVDPLILEVGCGSGWNCLVLQTLINKAVRYIGLDYSQAMINLGHRTYPHVRFAVGDATALPFRDRACDVVLMGGVLMHLVHYQTAIAEARRVASGWVILHTMPVLQQRQTTLLKKLAYGQPTAELIFNESSLRQIVTEHGLDIRHTLANLPYDLFSELGEHTVTKTYVCEVRS